MDPTICLRDLVLGHLDPGQVDDELVPAEVDNLPGVGQYGKAARTILAIVGQHHVGRQLKGRVIDEGRHAGLIPFGGAVGHRFCFFAPQINGLGDTLFKEVLLGLTLLFGHYSFSMSDPSSSGWFSGANGAAAAGVMLI